MRGKLITCAFGLLCLASVLAYSQQKQFAQHFFKVGNKPIEFEVFKSETLLQTPEISENIVYQQLFRLILSFERQAQKQANAGHSPRADFLRSYFQTKAGLNLEQSNTLKNYAGSFATEVKEIEKRYETARQPKDENLFLLDKLARERNQLLLEYRNRLRNVLGENSFENLDKFLQEKIASHIAYREDPTTHTASITQSLIDYDASNDEVCGYSVTDEIAGRGGRDSVVNIVHATLESDLNGVVDEQEYEQCNQSAEVYLYASGTSPNEEFCVMGEHEYAVVPILLFTDGKNNNNFPKSNNGSNNRGCYYEKSRSLPDTQDCLTIPPPPNVTGVSFQLIQPGSTAIDTNPNAEGGLRIFPDDDTPDDTTNRRRIRVTAGLSEQAAGKTIYFRSFDLDDPSTDMTIDPNGTMENDNNGNVNGSSAGQLSSMSATTNPMGIASVEFTVTMQPGDNFAIAAGTNPDEVGNVTVNGTALTSGSGASIDTNCDGTDAVCRSEMLTVWRRLHIEVDSMGVSDGNYILGTIPNGQTILARRQAILTVNPSPTQQLEVNRFENGRFVSGSSLSVISNTTNTVTVQNNTQKTIYISGNTQFQLYDDDDFNDSGILNGDTGEDIPEPPDSLLQSNDTLCSEFVQTNCNVFASSYIRPMRYTATDIRDNDIFQANIEAVGDFDPTPVRDVFRVDFDQIATEADPEFWTIYLYGSYQENLDRDADPTFENLPPPASMCPRTSYGVVDRLGPNGWGANVHMEVSRPHEYPSDYATRPVSRAWTAAHEVGHLFGGDHNDGGIMTPSCTRTGYEFDPRTIRRLRHDIMNP